MKNENESAAVSDATKPAPIDLGKLRELAELWAGKCHSAFQADRVRSSAAWGELEMYVQSLLATKPAEPVIPAPRVEDDALTLLEELSKWDGQGGMAKVNEFVGRAKAAGHLARQAQPTDRDADALDAARYRYLRGSATDIGNVIDKEFAPGMWEYRAGEELDTAIDAAIRALKGKSGEGAADA